MLVEDCQLEDLIEDAQLLISTAEGHVHVLPDARDVLLEDLPCGSCYVFLCIMFVCVFTRICLLKGMTAHIFRLLEGIQQICVQ